MVVFGGAVIGWLALSDMPTWPVYVFGIVSLAGFYLALAPLMRLWPWREGIEREPVEDWASTSKTPRIAFDLEDSSLVGDGVRVQDHDAMVKGRRTEIDLKDTDIR